MSGRNRSACLAIFPVQGMPKSRQRGPEVCTVQMNQNSNDLKSADLNGLSSEGFVTDGLPVKLQVCHKKRASEKRHLEN